MNQPKFERLKSQLASSGLRQNNPTLFQVINQMIDGLIQGQQATIQTISSSVATIITVEKEWSVLTNGNVASPELIFAGGDVIMTHTP